MAAWLACQALAAQGAERELFADSDCLAQGGAQSCEQLARAVSNQIESVRALGHALELRGRYAEAAATYQIALSVHPNRRELLQGLIRARGEARALALLEPSGADVRSAGQCWTARFTEALNACRAQLKAKPTDASLQERIGDLLRGTGQIDAALAAYDATLNLNPRAESARRKRTALATLVKNEPLSPQQTTGASPRNEPGSIAAPPLATGAQVDASRALPAAALQGGANGAGAANAGSFGRFRALIIGNERYKDFARLRSPLADAKAIAGLLQRDYGFEVRVLTNATRYQILSALSQLRKEAQDSDNVLVYYAGHGYLDEVTSRGYWLPIDAERDSVANWISTNDVADALTGLQARHAMIIADSCFSGTLLRGDSTAALDERTALIRRIAARRSRTIMTSGGLEPVVDDGDGKHSVFAEAFLQALSDNQSVLEAGRLFVLIRDHVAARATQTPQYGPLPSAGHQGGDFIFVRRE